MFNSTCRYIYIDFLEKEAFPRLSRCDTDQNSHNLPKTTHNNHQGHTQSFEINYNTVDGLICTRQLNAREEITLITHTIHAIARTKTIGLRYAQLAQQLQQVCRILRRELPRS